MKLASTLTALCALAASGVFGGYAAPVQAQSFNAYLLCEGGVNTYTCSVDPVGSRYDYSWQTTDGILIYPQYCGDRSWCQVNCYASASGTLQVTVTDTVTGYRSSDSAQLCGGAYSGGGGPGGEAGDPDDGGPGDDYLDEK